jgi:pimeloyl-ACP methyl ester carboxylesterase
MPAVTTRQPIRIATLADGRFDGFVDYPDLPGPRPVVVVCHGFKGFMEWGFFPALAELLAGRGFVVVRFNFTGAGMRPGEDRVFDLDAFRRDTYSGELAELLEVLAAVAGDGDIAGLKRSRIAPGPIGLLGHSRGGAIALLAAAHPDWRDRIGALVTWSAIAQVDRFTPEQKEAWRRDGELPVVNARTGQRLAMGLEILADVEENREALDLEAAAARRWAPWLIVHGGADESVPAAEGERLHAAAAEPRAIERIAGAGHTFGAVHPFAGPTPQLIQALNVTQTWFRRHLI